MSGKTWMALSILAEAARNKNFEDYALIHDDVENGADMDIEYYFGSKLASRLEPPARNKTTKEPVYSEMLEAFYYRINRRLDKGEKLVWVLDSMDGTQTRYQQEKFEERAALYEKDPEKKAAGDYGDGKAKLNSEGLRMIIPKLRDTGSILVIINQTRDNLGMGFEKKTRAGGRALRFYAHMEMWSSVTGTIQKTVNGQQRDVGAFTQFQIKKNRSTGRRRKVDVPIYHSYGVDDVGSCIDYLVQEKHWTKSKESINATELEFSGSRVRLIRHIEENNLEKAVAKICQKIWNDVNDQLAPKRKPKYE